MERWAEVEEAMSDSSAKDRAIHTLVDFIHCTGCRPNEAVQILGAHRDSQSG
jgi:hypothetical protein